MLTVLWSWEIWLFFSDICDVRPSTFAVKLCMINSIWWRRDSNSGGLFIRRRFWYPCVGNVIVTNTIHITKSGNICPESILFRCNINTNVYCYCLISYLTCFWLVLGVFPYTCTLCTWQIMFQYSLIISKLLGPIYQFLANKSSSYEPFVCKPQLIKA